MGKDFLSDEEMAALEEKDNKSSPDFISDEEMSDIEARMPQKPQITPYSTGKSTEDILLSLGQGAAMGYLPELTAALKSKSISSPQYEKEKQQMQQRLEQRGPIESGLGELAGSLASPVSIGGSALLRGTPSALRAAGVGAATGAIINQPDIESRLESAVKGGILGGGLSKIGQTLESKMASSAERSAFSALRPQKKQVIEANRMGIMNDIGREMIDQNIIGNIPRGPETLLKRTEEIKEKVGAAKGQLIKDIQSIVDKSKMENTVDLDSLRSKLIDKLKVNPDLPESQDINDKLIDFTSKIGRGKNSISIEKSDKLKTDIGDFIKKWYPKGKPSAEPIKEQFNKELYRTLNSSVDDAAETIAKQFHPEAVGKLKELKKSYGSLSKAEEILQNRFETDTANRMISPSDYATSIGAGLSALSYGSSAATSAGIATAAGGINQFLRKYGNQLRAKQLDNLSKIVGNEALQNYFLTAPITFGTRNKRLKALEESK